MSAVLNRRSEREPEERASQDKEQKKLYVEPRVTKEEVLPHIIGQSGHVPGSPGSILIN